MEIGCLGLGLYELSGVTVTEELGKDGQAGRQVGICWSCLELRIGFALVVTWCRLPGLIGKRDSLEGKDVDIYIS